MSIVNTTLNTTSPEVVYTSSGNSAITVIYICNTNDTVPTEINVHVVPNSGTPGQNNTVYYKVPLAAADTYVVDTEKLILSNGDSIHVSATITGNVVVTVSYVGI